MLRAFSFVVLLSAASSAARAGEPPELLGRWAMRDEPGKVVELEAGGTGTVRTGTVEEPLTWSADGARLTITDPSGSDTTGWKVVGDQLVLAGPFDSEIVLVRVAERPAKEKAPGPPGGRTRAGAPARARP